MKKILLPLFLLVSSFSFADEFFLKDLSGGLYSYPSANQIPDNACSELVNFYTDIEPIAIERNGYDKRDSTILGGTKAVTGLWEFVENDGDQWIISFSSRTFYKNTIGNTPTAFGPIMTVAQVPDCAVNLGVIMCVNGTDPAWIFNGASTSAVSGAPLGKLIEPWRTRFIISNITSAQSTVRVSEDGDYTNWTLGGEATDPFSFQIGGANDGFNVTCLWKSYLDNFVIGRKKDLWYLSGFSQSDFEVRNVSSELGCLQQGSMREFDGSLLFLSNRGMEELRGFTIQHISEPIRNITDDIVKNTANERSFSYTSQSDWESGVSTAANQLSTSLFPGSLSNKTMNNVLTADADWNNGSFDNTIYVDTETVPNSLQTTFPDTFDSFRTGSSGTKYVWTTWANSGATNLYAATDGVLVAHGTNSGSAHDIGMRSIKPTNNLSSGATIYFDVTESTRMVSASNAFYLLLNTTAYTNMFSARDNGERIRVTLFESGSCPSDQVSIAGPIFNAGSSKGSSSCYNTPVNVRLALTSTQFQLFGNNILISSGTHGITLASAYYIYLGYQFVTATDAGYKIDNFSVSPETFTWTSPNLSSGMDSPTWGKFTASLSTGAISFTTQVSPDEITFDAAVAVATGTAITSANKRYIKVNSFFNHIPSTFPTVVNALNDLNIIAASTGIYTSSAIALGSLVTSYGSVAITQTASDGNAITYEFNSSSTTTMNPSSWTAIVSGQTLSNPVNPYVAFRAAIAVSSVTSVVSIQDFNISWNEGAAFSPPIVSWNHDRRYWLAFTTSTASSPYNDKVLVYQRNRTWTLLDGINAASFATWRDALYFGNSNSTGYVYKFDIGNDDDASSISSRIRTKSYDLGQFFREKDFRYMYVNYLGNSGFTGSFTMTYDLDRSGGSYSLGSANLNEGTGQIIPKFQFSMDNPLQGREIQYVLTKSGTGDRLKLGGISTIYTIKEER